MCNVLYGSALMAILLEYTLFYLDCVSVRPDDGCMATETCRHSQYKNFSKIYVLLCFRF